jgi:hypothetical protein
MGRGGRKGDDGGVSFFAFQDIITAVIGILVLITLILALEVREKPPEEGNQSLAPSQVEIDLSEENNGTDFKALIAQQKKKNQEFQHIVTEETEILADQIQKLQIAVTELKEKVQNIESSADPALVEQMKKVIEDLEADLSFTKNNISELEKEKNGLKDQLDSNPMAFMNEEEKTEYVERLMSDVEQLEKQVKNDVRVIPEETNTTLKPVLVSISANELSIGEFNKEQITTAFSRDSFVGELLRGYKQYNKDTHYIVFFFKPSACQMTVPVPTREGLLDQLELFDTALGYAQNLGFKFGWEPIHEEAALIFSNKNEEGAP